MTNKRKIINDPVYGFLTIDDDILFDVISHPFFQRQRHIKQLGFTSLVYPGAVHTRLSHMLGALNLMTRALEVLKVKGVDISDEESLGVRLAILLHDVGHGPFSHTSEHTIVDVHHETLTRLFMQRLNVELSTQGHGIHPLDTAIEIFNDTYKKHFLHQLVSSQLDMDRLDYLSRDSFFSGVSEGIVGTERIINMLNVSNDELVVDEKGIYSVEKFIISRRLMYWQVYMHKTVIAADSLLCGLFRRVRELLAKGVPVDGPRFLIDFLSHSYNEASFVDNPELLDHFALIDDNDVMTAVKMWLHHPDIVLSSLASQLVYRHLPAISVSDHPFPSEQIEQMRLLTQRHFGISLSDTEYFVGTGVLKNHAYDFNDQEIKVLYKDGSCCDISEASDQLDRHFLEKQVTKYYFFFPKELK
ncbi:MAG: HD domain-containing protein [Bacteroidales bacterium]|nr:HD domain-containing protein [Bacteroidales bacterium]